jgi:hypothetical protein
MKSGACDSSMAGTVTVTRRGMISPISPGITQSQPSRSSNS